MKIESHSDFLMTFAHDLRQPLRSIMMSAQRMQRGQEELSLEMRAKVEEIAAAARRQEELIASVVEYDQALASASSADSPLPVRLAIQTACMKVDAFRQAQQGLIQFDAQQVPRVLVSPELARVLEKCLHNGLKFHTSDSSPRVTVQVSETSGDLVVVRVSDWGLGIETEYREAVFEPFKRLNANSDFPGSGLGLATCRRLVHAMKGTIRFEDNGSGQGVSLVVILPRLEAGV